MQSRTDILARLRAQVAAGVPIVGGGAGTGLSAKCAEMGGIDLIIIYNSGRFRMAGRGSLAGLLPYGDANQIVMDMAREVLPVVHKTPVLAGVSAIDAPGQPFHDPGADAALFEALERTIQRSENRRLTRVPLHINDPQFAAALVEQFHEIAARP